MEITFTDSEGNVEMVDVPGTVPPAKEKPVRLNPFNNPNDSKYPGRDISLDAARVMEYMSHHPNEWLTAAELASYIDRAGSAKQIDQFLNRSVGKGFPIEKQDRELKHSSREPGRFRWESGYEPYSVPEMSERELQRKVEMMEASRGTPMRDRKTTDRPTTTEAARARDRERKRAARARDRDRKTDRQYNGGTGGAASSRGLSRRVYLWMQMHQDMVIGVEQLADGLEVSRTQAAGAANSLVNKGQLERVGQGLYRFVKQRDMTHDLVVEHRQQVAERQPERATERTAAVGSPSTPVAEETTRRPAIVDKDQLPDEVRPVGALKFIAYRDNAVLSMDQAGVLWKCERVDW